LSGVVVQGAKNKTVNRIHNEPELLVCGCVNINVKNSIEQQIFLREKAFAGESVRICFCDCLVTSRRSVSVESRDGILAGGKVLTVNRPGSMSDIRFHEQ
jgi:hypothetical protein